ncbi:hypothetical protein CH370_08345 [Leptospira kmetyi]|uniref:hypothetical protein n=1 Tax=Leptospira kmetyi TaxID=408139 RepID=UPI000C2B0654|nr:hypothetical protein [Leptospira kmetyi]PJZ42230.1 hypothetical protein CH370_08345 [Leptospira kmetyi]TGK17673.1 hypothetical protein EHO62_08280 [Leptospira kmetyi]TGK25067.1 hypothetical protein EHO66_19655 [Leptospira kmetyi]
MGSALFKTWIGCTLLSVLILTLNCGPICCLQTEFEKHDSVSTNPIPCQQEQNSQGTPSCDWDPGSLALSENDSPVSKLIRIFLPSHFYSANVFFSFLISIERVEFVSQIVFPISDFTDSLETIRLLI